MQAAPGDLSPSWQIEFTPQAERWFKQLPDKDADKVAQALDHLELTGPATRRPHADSIKGSRYHSMKELRSVGGNLRALFVFDPRRHAIVLLGGDKTNDWQRWYARNIPLADKLYDKHLRSLGGGGGGGPWTARYRNSRPGGRSGASGR